MQGINDAPMRAFQGVSGAFTFGVAEYIRVSNEPVPLKVFLRDVPELNNNSKTPTGMPVQVQLLGGEPETLAQSALTAIEAGAKAIDLNFGCPARIVNLHDGGASLLKQPKRIRTITEAVRRALPPEVPVSAKIRLGWDRADAVFEITDRAIEGGASWLTIHARTKIQAYLPPVNWEAIAKVRERVNVPVVANGDIWTPEDFKRCREITGCTHYMIGRGALANPMLPREIACEMGMDVNGGEVQTRWFDWVNQWLTYSAFYGYRVTKGTVCHLKEWLRIASDHGSLSNFDEIKKAKTIDDILDSLVG
jgi:tRNA-dihydrouridine synthase C